VHRVPDKAGGQDHREWWAENLEQYSVVREESKLFFVNFIF
jgi:hypothetical protein